MQDMTATSSTLAEDRTRFLIGLCNAMAFGALFWTASWWLLA